MNLEYIWICDIVIIRRDVSYVSVMISGMRALFGFTRVFLLGFRVSVMGLCCCSLSFVCVNRLEACCR